MDELTLIKTPNSYIKLGATRTLLQQDSLLMVSAYLQDYVEATVPCAPPSTNTCMQGDPCMLF